MATETVNLPLWARRLISGAFVLLFVPTAIYGFMHLRHTGTVLHMEVDQDLVQPYLVAMQQEDWGAMHALRTPDAQEQITPVELEERYAQNIAPLGRPLSLELRFIKERQGGPFGHHYFATLDYTATKGTRMLSFVVRRRAGPDSRFGIARTIAGSRSDSGKPDFF